MQVLSRRNGHTTYLFSASLVQGGFVQQDNVPGGQINASANFVSGNESGGTSFTVIPEPESIFLVLTGLVLTYGISRKQKIRNSVVAPT
ncbi:PEP-CTERM sorting domain-containing protein [Massilia sp. MS-15]|uniref:PEP-CTERM sorting domain-containing protein n=1 Tax=Massilia sp. MS-15 TaxID=2878200 RepID=UPI001CD1BB24|nr:PEP-CTERM sorting domain-containing protein [Massilia sp. MS-15]